MSDPVDALLLDMLEWIVKEERSYAEVMDAWRTSCPKLPVWEEANERGFVLREYKKDRGPVVCLTPRGREFLNLRNAPQK